MSDEATTETDPDTDRPTAVLAEVAPGVVAAYGDLPAHLDLTPLDDFSAVPAVDRAQVTTLLSAVGASAAVTGVLGQAAASAQGLYRLADASQALMNSGGVLAIKDGANLGAIFKNGEIVAQARFVEVNPLSLAQGAASLGPALAMIALQAQLNEVTSLVRSNIALTTQVLTTLRQEQWATLTGLSEAVDHALDDARSTGAVPRSIWDTVAGKRADLVAQRDLYHRKVTGHIAELQQRQARARREYLQDNAETIFFDAHALLTALKAWVGHRSLYAAHTRGIGDDPAAEERLVTTIQEGTHAELESALPEAVGLIDALTRELRVIAELPGRPGSLLPSRRRDAQASRAMSARLLEALTPLADSLRPPSPELVTPEIAAAPDDLDVAPHLRVLRWFLDGGETLRALAFPDQLDDPGPFAALLSGAKDRLAALRDREPERTLVAVTDRRVLIAATSDFLEEGEITHDLPLDQVRYLRLRTSDRHEGATALDLVTRDENLRWLFDAEIDRSHVDALAAVLAESMAIPEEERTELLGSGPAVIETKA
ncbi:MAG: hypothetical protein QM621_06870 [Aeromicrobium sp.]|uniref:hypothetical protein n=1 Tax=Aeromicrobium sp. TaxID=1871063 RepID=UPI0039E43191